MSRRSPVGARWCSSGACAGDRVSFSPASFGGVGVWESRVHHLERLPVDGCGGLAVPAPVDGGEPEHNSVAVGRAGVVAGPGAEGCQRGGGRLMADLDKSIEAVEPLRSEAGLGELFSGR